MAEGEGETVSMAPDSPGPILPRYFVFYWYYVLGFHIRFLKQNGKNGLGDET